MVKTFPKIRRMTMLDKKTGSVMASYNSKLSTQPHSPLGPIARMSTPKAGVSAEETIAKDKARHLRQL